jgi:hypothetical protein
LVFTNPFYLSELSINYSLLAIILNILKNHKKDIIKKTIIVLAVKIDLELIKARRDFIKLIKAIKLTTIILQKSRLSLYNTKLIASFLS